MRKNAMPWRSIGLYTLIVLLVIFLSGCSWLPGLSLGRRDEEVPRDDLDSPALPAREVVVYYTGPEGSIPGSEDVLVKHYDKISYISGFWYQIDRSNPQQVAPLWNCSEADIKATVDLAHSRGVKVEALFHNLMYGSGKTSEDVVRRLLADRTLSNGLAAELVRLAQTMHFDGVNIDIEYVPSELRQQFTAFVETIATSLHRNNIRVSISVPAKTGDDPHNGWSGAYDYAALGALVDRVMLMTYDEHGWASESDGPIASSGWVRSVVSYAVSQIPADKLLVGLPAYGFRWTEGKPKPFYLDYVAAMNPVWMGQASLRWDEVGNVPHYEYTEVDGTRHKVWFENAASSSWKLDIMQQYQLRGFALWRAGMEDPNLWSLVAQKMRTEK